MIESIKIKKIASYSEDGCEINNLKKLNFFFGANGSGKSTIGRYLHALSLSLDKKDEKYSQCQQVGYDSAKEVIKVFNTDYVKANFYNNDCLDGVFSFNEKNDIIEKAIKDKEERIRQINEVLSEKLNKKTELNNSLNKTCKEGYEKVFDERKIFEFASAPNAKIKYSGNKESFYNEMKNRTSINTKTFEVLKNDYSNIFVNERNFINGTLPSEIFDEIEQIRQKLNVYLNAVIIGKEDVPIKYLIDKLNNRAWVEQGKKFLSLSEGKCPFCQEPLKNDFLEQLENIFDEQYKKSINEINNLSHQYNSKTTSFISSLQYLLQEYDDEHIVSNFKNKIASLFEKNKEIISKKLLKPNETTEIDSFDSLRTEAQNININISELNDLISNKTNRIQQYNNDILDFLANKTRNIIIDFESKKQEIITQLQIIEQEESQLNSERAQLKAEPLPKMMGA